ncbi:diguanylate cyclase domain-containing protein [Blautia sp. HCP3S3_H10_1]|uniref:GGDEF domain-containing protein n=1 Tax=unclassified Blautia TaxID=2648079 RepID=UPI003F8E7948
MNAQYTATIFLILFALFIMILVVRNNELLGEQKKAEFIAIFAMIMVSAASEWFGNFLDGKSESLRILHIAMKCLDHSVAPVIAIIFMNILSTREKAEKLIPILVIHGILEAASGYFGFIYYIDDKNVYYHGPYYWIYIAVYLYCTINLLIEAARFSKKYQSANRFILEMVFLFLVAGMILRLANSEIHVDYLCVAIDAIILYIYYTEIVEKTDSITNLLNRRSYESYLEHMNVPAVILYFDVDDFKSINDRYGHHVGDFCLQTVGKCLQEVYASYGHCYRIGGDEFCVLLEKKLNSVDELNQKLKDKLDELRKNDKRIPYVSIGYIFFNPEKTDVESAIKEADAQMYRVKKAGKVMRRERREAHV